LAALGRAEQGSDAAARADAARDAAARAVVREPRTEPEAAGPRRKLSFKEQRELDSMETAIESAERAHATAEARVADPAVAADHVRMAAACAELERAQSAVQALYARWQELESKRGA
jgi:ATP-binding cassette subfamily F protein uup